MSILFVTHNLGVVAEIAHEVVVMYAGRVVEQAPVDALFERQKHPYTQGLLACIPNPRGDRDAAGGKRLRLKPIPGNVPSVTRCRPAARFAPRCPYRIEKCDREPAAAAGRPGALSRCWRHEIL